MIVLIAAERLRQIRVSFYEDLVPHACANSGNVCGLC